MTDLNAMRARADFASARTKAIFRELVALLTGRNNALLAFDQVSEKLHVGGPIYRGVKTVPLKQVIGSVNRYKDFDRAFLPTQTFTADRWQRVSRAWYDDVSLPPVLLYKVGEAYFVVDGHHRVSVARDQGQEFIDAEVRECRVKVPVSPDLEPDDLEVLGEQVEFLERTGLDHLRPGAAIMLTILGGYERMLEHIAVHKFFMGLNWRRDIGDEEAVSHWHDAVYTPLVEAIRNAGVLEKFSGKTETDLYLWVIDHQHFLREQEPGITSEEAAEDFAARYARHRP